MVVDEAPGGDPDRFMSWTSHIPAGVIPYSVLMARAALFALTGFAFLAYWVVANPSFEATASQGEWPHVLGFSGALLTLAVALPVFGRMVGGRWVTRLSLVAGSGVALSSVANVFEDGLRIEWVFFVFILGEMINLVALVILSLLIAWTGRGLYRLLALVPAGTIAGVILFVVGGGVIMFVTWLAAAAIALAMSTRATDPQDAAAAL